MIRVERNAAAQEAGPGRPVDRREPRAGSFDAYGSDATESRRRLDDKDLWSKYSLALYEMIQKRGNLSKSFEDVLIADLRSFLGVPPGGLTRIHDLSHSFASFLVNVGRSLYEVTQYAAEIGLRMSTSFRHALAQYGVICWGSPN